MFLFCLCFVFRSFSFDFPWFSPLATFFFRWFPGWRKAPRAFGVALSSHRDNYYEVVPLDRRAPGCAGFRAMSPPKNHQNRSKINQKNDQILTWFLIVFWSVLGAMLAPFGHPNRPQIDLRSVQDGFWNDMFWKKWMFTKPCKNKWFFNIVDPKIDPKTT